MIPSEDFADVTLANGDTDERADHDHEDQWPWWPWPKWPMTMKTDKNGQK